jgi:S1-C subfamily serine protease
LPDQVRQAWDATVLIEGAAIVESTDRSPRLRFNRGAGIVVRGAHASGEAVIVTNNHVVLCGEEMCYLRVGFTDPALPDAHIWTRSVVITSTNPGKDLAFLSVQVPDRLRVTPARFSTPSCVDDDDPGIVAIGWPDLSLRGSWGVDPPENSQDHVKRFSVGKFLIDIDDYRPVSCVRGMLDRMQVVFHNADVLPGSSGGPLVIWGGDVIGINSQVVGGASSLHNQYCARQELHDEGAGCVHLAISAAEVVEEFEELFNSRVEIADCSPLTEDENLRSSSPTTGTPIQLYPRSRASRSPPLSMPLK